MKRPRYGLVSVLFSVAGLEQVSAAPPARQPAPLMKTRRKNPASCYGIKYQTVGLVAAAAGGVRATGRAALPSSVIWPGRPAARPARPAQASVSVSSLPTQNCLLVLTSCVDTLMLAAALGLPGVSHHLHHQQISDSGRASHQLHPAATLHLRPQLGEGGLT